MTRPRTSPTCFECGLPDPYDGHGDGIGSCQCPRCPDCGRPPGICNCDPADAYDDGTWLDPADLP